MPQERTYEQQIREGLVLVQDKDGTVMTGLVTAMGPYWQSIDGTPTTEARTEIHVVLLGVKWDIVKKQPIWPPPGSEV